MHDMNQEPRAKQPSICERKKANEKIREIFFESFANQIAHHIYILYNISYIIIMIYTEAQAWTSRAQTQELGCLTRAVLRAHLRVVDASWFRAAVWNHVR